MCVSESERETCTIAENVFILLTINFGACILWRFCRYGLKSILKLKVKIPHLLMGRRRGRFSHKPLMAGFPREICESWALLRSIVGVGKLV